MTCDDISGISTKGEFVCPSNSKHTLKITDHDDHFDELTCVSCGSRIYKPKEYSQKAIVDIYNGGIYLMSESYEIMEDYQPDIEDEEESFNLMCSEAQRLYN